MKKFCTVCGYEGKPKIEGNVVLLLLLLAAFVFWPLFFVMIFYLIFRKKKEVCPKCGGIMIPLNSPMYRKR